MNWPNDKIFVFLEQYRSENILWESKHPGAKCRVEVDEAWLRIANALDGQYSVDDLKKKKESLMASYRLQKKRKLKHPTYTPRWFAYNFMDDFLSDNYSNSNTTEDTIYHESPSNDHQMPKKPKLSIQQQHPTPNRRQSNFIYLKTTEQDQKTDDIDLYGQLLVRKLRRLTEEQRDLAMHEIDNVLFQAKMRSKTPKTPQVIVKLDSQVFIDDNYEGDITHETDPMPESP